MASYESWVSSLMYSSIETPPELPVPRLLTSWSCACHLLWAAMSLLIVMGQREWSSSPHRLVWS